MNWSGQIATLEVIFFLLNPNLELADDSSNVLAGALVQSLIIPLF